MKYINDHEAFHFQRRKDFTVRELTPKDIEILDLVIEKYGHMKTQDLINHMHEESAYKCTNKNCIIDYSYANEIQI